MASLEIGTSFFLCFLGGGRESCKVEVREVGRTDTVDGPVDNKEKSAGVGGKAGT